MSVLSDQELENVLDEEVVIHPHDDPSCFSSKGYDLRVGFALALNQGAHTTEASDTSALTIKPGTSAFIITKEYVWLSNKLVGTFHARGKLAAQGLFMDSTMIDSLWKGQLLFLVFNASRQDIVLQVGDKFVTMMLHRVNVPTARQPRSGSFVDVVQERGKIYGEPFLNKLVTYLSNPDEKKLYSELVEKINTAQKPPPTLPARIWSKLKKSFKDSKRSFPSAIRQMLTVLVWLLVVGLLVVSATLQFYWSWLQSFLHFSDPYGGTVLITQFLVFATVLGLVLVLLRKN